tara:strand:+ start:73 stop:792 length:720 start_codon:yes stop_codon:yes gene_type:complete
LEIKGKYALITGSANRIGREIAIHLSKLGVNVAIHYNNSKENAIRTLSEVMSNNVESEIFNANLSVESECLELYKKVNASLGPISILINNASTFRKNNLENTTTNELKEDYFVNVLAPFILAQNIFKNKNVIKGKIINISDWKTARTNRFSYGVSKSGIFGLTKSLAVSMAPNFQVNEIAFGAMLPPADEPDRIPQKINLGPMQRIAKMSEINECIEMLLKNDFITGEKIYLDGGRHIY